MANVNNYIAAGRASVKKNLMARKALSDNKTDFGALGQEAIKAERDKKIAVIRSNAKVANASADAMTQVKGAEIIVDRDKSIANSKRSVRKAGMLAAGVQALGAASYLNNKKDKPNEQLPLIEQQLAKFNQRAEDARSDINSIDSETYKAPDSVQSPNLDTTKPSQFSGGSLNLTDNDFKELAYAVSSEASLGTDDEFGVAANIITRLNSGNYGSSISEIIRAPGQYEGVYKGKSKYSPEIQSRLQSPEGQAKISEFIKRLNGRTEFKGQSMLHNRVKDEDPMFDPSGNFYHYAGQ